MLIRETSILITLLDKHLYKISRGRIIRKKPLITVSEESLRVTLIQNSLLSYRETSDG